MVSPAVVVASTRNPRFQHPPIGRHAERYLATLKSFFKSEKIPTFVNNQSINKESIEMKRLILTFGAILLASVLALAAGPKSNLRVMYWNIQNGMWSDQGNSYDNFVEYVKSQNPDICVWCEAQSIYITGTAVKCAVEDRYLVDGWAELAARYGHSYVFVGGHRDNFPQVITSKYPIEGIERITGNLETKTPEQTDTIVSHGAGWARIRFRRKELNVVTLHTWPQAYSFYASKEEREASKAAHGGDAFRAVEMEYILKHTIGRSKKPSREYWMMMGDFNSRSRVDNYQYKWAEDAPGFACQDVIIENGRYVDVIAALYPGEFKTTTGGKARIDYFYCTPKLFSRITAARIPTGDWSEPVRDPAKLSNFWHPSDHRPIIVDFKL